MIGRIKEIGLILLAVAACLVGFYSSGKRAGKKAVELKQKRDTVKAIKAAKDVEKNIRSISDPDVSKRLQSWYRD